MSARFWSKVDRSGGPDACWPWTGTVARYGVYAQDKRRTKAHRWAWELARGPIPPGLLVCHRCNNPVCCNPNHLYVGTQRENMCDREAVGRTRRGARHYRARMTEFSVRLMRNLHRRGASHRLLSRAFGLSRTQVRNICRRESWRHVT